MKAIRKGWPLLVLATALTACGGGGGSHHVAAPPTATNFTTFVQGLLTNTSDTAAPVSVNNRDFQFSDKTNPGAYNSSL